MKVYNNAGSYVSGCIVIQGGSVSKIQLWVLCLSSCVNGESWVLPPNTMQDILAVSNETKPIPHTVQS